MLTLQSLFSNTRKPLRLRGEKLVSFGDYLLLYYAYMQREQQTVNHAGTKRS
jgi:hypothetical protein